MTVTLALGVSLLATPRAEALGGSGPKSQPTFRYRHVPIDAVPEGFVLFDARAVDGRGRVLGTAVSGCDENLVDCRSAIYAFRDGKFRLVDGGPDLPGAYVANENGQIGGSIIVDRENFKERAVIWRGRRRELVPLLPGLSEQTSTFVEQLTDSGLALIGYFDETGFGRYLYDDGETRALSGIPQNWSVRDINSRGIVTGIANVGSPLQIRAYRLDTRSERVEIFEPVAPDRSSWGLAINRKGEVLGYSFVSGGVERIGFWDRRGKFNTAWVQGTPEVPTLSNRLAWNENGLIVISDTSDGKIYLVPRPGERLDLATLVSGFTLPSRPAFQSMNDRGDLLFIDRTTFGIFLLERVDVDEHEGAKDGSKHASSGPKARSSD